MERVAFLIEPGGERIDCLLNPETVLLRRQAGIRRRSLVGELLGDSAWSDDTLVCGGGGFTELQLDLLFDTSLVVPPDECDDVQTLTRPFWDLSEHGLDGNGHYQPHVVRLVWGKAWNMPGVVAAVAERFECFLPSGAPQRSWLRMSLIRVAERASQNAATRGERFDPDGLGTGDAPSRFDAGTPDTLSDDLAVDPGSAPARPDQRAYAMTGNPGDWRRFVGSTGAWMPDALRFVGEREAESEAGSEG